MDYRSQTAAFKARKILRYAQLYGPRRTILKVEGNVHMRRAYRALPSLRPSADSSATVGIIGCGNFAYGTIAYYLSKNHGRVIRAAMDVNVNRAASLGRRFKADYYTTDAGKLMDDDRIDMVFIASNHASHADYAIEALARGKHVHIEKPHVVDRDQLERLTRAMETSPGRVALGFNRPDSALGREVRHALAAESGPAVMNWFVVGHEIPAGHWYLDEKEGGRVLGNLCHWTDFVYRTVDAADRYPLRIVPTPSVGSDGDIAVSYVFGDGTMAVITFSAKGHTFEGVRERFSAHRGDTVLSLDDFQTVVTDKGEVKRRRSLAHRDHGHEAGIERGYEMSRPASTLGGCTARYVWETADLFLATKQALEEEKELVLLGRPDEAPSAG